MLSLRSIKIMSSAAFILGFVLPFISSRYVGMPLPAHPGIVAAHGVLWIIALVLGYRAYVMERQFAVSVPLWLRVCSYITGTSATWVLLGIVFGYLYNPTLEKSVFAANVNQILAITLFVMGIQITTKDWRLMVRNARVVSLVVILRWLIMPVFGYCVSYVVFSHLFLPPATANMLAVGMMVLCTSPTGAASNSLTLLSRGDLALSVSATTLNTLLAPFLQPWLLKLFVGKMTTVDTYGMFLDLVRYVLLPVVVASILGAIFPKVVVRIKPLLGPVAVISLAVVIMSTVSKGTSTILHQLYVLPYLIVACVIQGLAGLSLGYFAPKYLGFTRAQRIASCFEIGVENAAIAPTLAVHYFGPLAAIPGILYGKIQNLLAITIFVRKFQNENEQADIQQLGATTASDVSS
ncbi:MAG: bile acid:sodium symporter family protein [Alicyclobacillus sp.]|nr:bile acid:sodium symporter family protein [Alicyclobacillus sp.]